MIPLPPQPFAGTRRLPHVVPTLTLLLAIAIAGLAVAPSAPATTLEPAAAPGFVEVRVTPPEALGAGARWRVKGSAFTSAWFLDSRTSVPAGSYTVEFQPVAGWTEPPTSRISVAAGATVTLAGYDASYTLNFTRIASTAAQFTSQTLIPVTVNFRGPVTGFSSEDVQLTNCTLQGFTALSGSAYAFLLEPDGEGLFTVDIPTGACTMTATGRLNAAAQQFTRVYDITGPVATLTSPNSEFIRTYLLLSAEFNEPVRPLDPALLADAPDAISTMTTISPTRIDFALARATHGEFTYTLDAGDYQDLAGNPGQSAPEVSRFNDIEGPVMAGPPGTDVSFVIGTTAQFYWYLASDSGIGLAGYECEIGTRRGESDNFSGWIGLVHYFVATGRLGETLYCRVRGVDGLGNAGPWAETRGGVLLARPPEAPIITLTPAQPRTVDDVTATAVSLDPDFPGSVLNYRYMWIRDGRIECTSRTLPRELTTRGQGWTCRAVAYKRFGEMIVESPLSDFAFTIVNTAPTQPLVEIKPDPVRGGHELAATARLKSTDYDGDPIAYRYLWRKSNDRGQNWFEYPELSASPIVPGVYVVDGDWWELVCTPYETILPQPSGGAGAAPAPSQSVRVEGIPSWDRLYVGANSPPQFAFTAIDCEPNTPATRLSVTWSCSDPDEEFLRVQLYWTDSLDSGLVPLQPTIQQTQRAFEGLIEFPKGRPIRLHAIVTDTKGDVTQVLTPPLVLDPGPPPRNAARAGWTIYR